MGGAHLWEVPTYGRCPLVGGAHLWEVSTYGRCPLMGGAHLWEVPTYGRCPLMGGAHLFGVSDVLSPYGKLGTQQARYVPVTPCTQLNDMNEMT